MSREVEEGMGMLKAARDVYLAKHELLSENNLPMTEEFMMYFNRINNTIAYGLPSEEMLK